MKIPFSVVMSAVLSLASIVITSGVLMAMDFEWTYGVLAIGIVLLFSIGWPASALAMARRILDDRMMSIDEVAVLSHGTMPEPILRGVYKASVVLLFTSLGMLAIGAVLFFFQSASDLGRCSSQGFPAPLIGGSVAGLIASGWMAVIQRRKIPSLMRASVCCAGGFSWIGATALIHG